MRYKITIEYDGSGYVGWQKQPDQPNKSIEELIEKAIFAMSGEVVKLNCAGRTDAGVHALGQVADFNLEKNDYSEHRIIMGLNQHLLNQKIAIINCQIVDDSFHSRFDAVSRTYIYKIINRSAKLTLDQNRAWHVPIPLDIKKMQQAADLLIGEQDFSSFRDSKCQSNTPIKTINVIDISHNDQQIAIKINAKSFLHHMVRNIVGTLYLVGSQQMQLDEFSEVIAAKDRTKSGQNAPAHGLYLYEIEY